VRRGREKTWVLMLSDQMVDAAGVAGPVMVTQHLA